MLRDGHHSATGSVRRYNHTFSKTPALRLAMTEVWAGDDSSGPPGRLVVRCRLWPQGGGLVSTETGPVSPPPPAREPAPGPLFPGPGRNPRGEPRRRGGPPMNAFWDR